MPSSDDRHNILHVILDLELAGAQESLCTLAENLKANDWALTVCAFRDGPLRKRIEASGVAVELLKPPRCSVSNLSLYLAEIRRIRRELLRLVKAHKVSLIQTHILGPLDFLILSLRYTSSWLSPFSRRSFRKSSLGCFIVFMVLRTADCGFRFSGYFVIAF